MDVRLAPEFVMGLGSLDTLKDGRDVYDNIQLIYKYPKGQKMTYSSISTNSFLPYFNGSRPEMGEIIMGTRRHGRIHRGRRRASARSRGGIASRPRPSRNLQGGREEEGIRGGRHHGGLGGGANGPIPIMTAISNFTGKESFLDKEVKFAKRWLTTKGVMVQEEQRNPVDMELESFFDCCRTGKTPMANLEVGMADSVAVILSNQAMDEGRKVYFNEIEKTGKPAAAPVKKG